MAISDRLNKLTTDITNAYTSIENKGGTIPANKNTNNLPTAIDSIQNSNIIGATAEGESLSLTNTKAMPYSDYVVKGKSEQATRSGKNKMKTSSSIWKNALTSAIYNSATDEFTFHRDNGTDYLIDFNKLDLEDNTKYYIKFIVSENTMEANFLDIISSSRLTGNISIPAGQTGTFDFTLASGSGTQLYDLWLYCNSTGTLKTKIMISAEQGDYEPYGVSPSPDYPSDINSVADDVNLFDKEAEVLSTGYISSYTSSNGVYTIIPTGTGNPQIRLKCILVAGTYTLNSEAYLSIATILRNNNGLLNNFQAEYQNQTFTTTETSAELVFNWTNPNNTNPITLDLRTLKIQKGTVAAPYSPYNQGTVTIKQRGTTENNDYTIQTEPLRSLPNGVKDTIEAEQHRKIGKQTGTLTETTTITLSDAKTNGAYMCNIKPSGTLTGKTIELEAGDYEIIYELEEEIIEPLTQNQATTMLDIIKTGSYEGTTNIYTDEDVKPTIEVEYYKKA